MVLASDFVAGKFYNDLEPEQWSFWTALFSTTILSPSSGVFGQLY